MSEFRQVKARKTTSALSMLRKQAVQSTQLNNRRGSAHGVASTSTSTKKSTHSDTISQRAPYANPAGARTIPNNPRHLITSRPYSIAGVAGFHRGAKLPVYGASQPVRRNKPPPRKSAGGPRLHHLSKKSGGFPVSNQPRNGTAKGLARRSGAATRMTSSRKRDLRLLDQQRNQFDSAVYASVIFGKTPQNRRFVAAPESSSDEEKPTVKRPNNDVGAPPGRESGLVADDDGDDAPWRTMMAAFGTLSLSVAAAAHKRRLPFLRRVVKTSFRRRCQRTGIVVDPVSPPTRALTVLYKLAIDVSEDESDNDVTVYSVHKVKLAIDKLLCPLCDTLGSIHSKEMLEAHMEWDHSDVEASWRQKQGGNWELALELRGGEVDEWEGAESPLRHDFSYPPSPVRPLSPTDTLRGSSVGAGELLPPARETAEATEALEQHDFLKTDFFLSPASHRPSFVSAAVSSSAHRVPETGDPLGPLAVYPYLPTSGDDESLLFSCRPGGPRLFDLISRFSASEYGLTSWSLIERDEELFEIDDMRDEEKAMQALWNRWIFFERRRYLLDPKKTTIAFVDKFLAVIMKTAGWKGMRVWLLLLAKHKYLTGDDVVEVMSYYETAAGIGPQLIATSVT
ncbi:hypothetical protein EDB89DRAFT_733538 [Lactarius sanguifluus]|nr:hypothetical protein EDB89DRAFT_733538 [Lactarius sanguifluus]